MTTREPDIVVAKFDYKAADSQELDIQKNEKLTLMDDSQHWWKVMNSQGQVGYVPSNYVKRSKQGLFSSLRNTLGRRKSRSEATPGAFSTGHSTGGRASKLASPAAASANGFAGQGEAKASMESLGYAVPPALPPSSGNMPQAYQTAPSPLLPPLPADATALSLSPATNVPTVTDPRNMRDSLAHTGTNATETSWRSHSSPRSGQPIHPGVGGSDHFGQYVCEADAGMSCEQERLWSPQAQPSTPYHATGPPLTEGRCQTSLGGALGDGFSSVGPRQICVARFAYTACNPDELSIQRGDHLRVLEKSSDGWWRGVLITEGKPQVSGWFPSNYVAIETSKSLWGSSSSSQPNSLNSNSLVRTAKVSDHSQFSISPGSHLPSHNQSSQPVLPPKFPQTSQAFCSVPVPFPTTADGQTPVTAVSLTQPDSKQMAGRPAMSKSLVAPAPQPFMETVLTLYPFTRNQVEELSFEMDEVLEVVEKPADDPDWWRCRNASGNVGLVPRNYVRLISNPSVAPSASRQQNHELLSVPSSTTSVTVPQSVPSSSTSVVPSGLPRGDEIRAAFAARSVTSSAFARKPWCWGIISRSDCEFMLNNLATPGEFIIRDSESHPGDLTITMNAGSKNRNFKVHVEGGKFHIGQKVFPSIDTLIEHYRTHPIYKSDQEKHFLTQPFQHPNCGLFLRQLPGDFGRPPVATSAAPAAQSVFQ
nr:unnamed protein product [Spirometra erinaceieuropaei]